jgi:DNA-binding MarR family transcriptional regulator
MIQALSDAQDAGEAETCRDAVDAGAVDAVLTASRSLISVATRSLGAAAEETTIAQYRALVVLASRGPQRMVDLAGALDVAPSTAGRMCDRLVRKGLIRRHRARADRRAVLVSLTAAGRQVVDQATARRRALIADILAKLPAGAQRAVAEALRAFADAAGEVPDSKWPPPEPVGEAAGAGQGGAARAGEYVRPSANEGR